MKKMLLCCLQLCLSAAVAWSQPTVSATLPASRTICAGSNTTFSITASGAATLTYQWEWSPDGTLWSPVSEYPPLSGTTTPTLTISNAPDYINGYHFRCVVTNGQGSTNSSGSVITVNDGPQGQTTNQTFPSCSQDLQNTANAIDPSLNYQWQTSTDNGATWNNITDGAVYTGSSTFDLTWNVNMSLNGNLLRFIATDPATGCSTTSTGVDVIYVIGSPSFLTPTPTSAAVCPGGAADFAITDSAGVSYQWEMSTNGGATYSNTTDGSFYTGSTTNSLAISGVTTTAAGRYRVIRSVTEYGLTCSTFSQFGTLSTKTLTSITTPPANATVCAGSTAAFHVTTGGSGPFIYQWQTDNGTSPSVWTNTGAGLPTLSNSAVTTAMNGYHYQVLVQGACGAQLTTPEVTLQVNGSGTWLGTANTYWENTNNWCGGVPVQATDVVIPATAPNMPTISATTGTAYSTALNIANGAVLTISGGTTSMLGPFSILGAVAYTAAGAQTILPADHGSLIIGGSGNKTLSANTGISNTLTLGGTAMLVTGSDLLTMYAGSNPISGASFGSAASSWIVTGNGSGGAGNTGLGGLKIAQVSPSSGNVLFPVGPTPAAYAPAQLTNSGAVNDFTIAVNDQYIPGGPANATVDRTWLVSGTTAGTGVISLGLQWNQADEGSLFTRNSAYLIRSNGINIVQQSALGSAAGSNPYSLAGGGFSSFTQFSVASGSMVVLSSQLLSFTGQWLDDNSITLGWTTNPQNPTRAFDIQRSTDGAGFNTIGTVAADGGDAYSFVDLHPSSGNNAYRLRVLYADGSTSYSQIVQLNGAAMTDQAGLAPSITENGVSNLLLALDHGTGLTYTLTDISGHTLLYNSIQLASGQHTLPVDISRFPAGVYFVHLAGTDGFNKTLTLIRK